MTERVDRAMEDVLQGGTRDSELTDYERRYFDALAARVRSGDLHVTNEIWRLDYIKTPPDIRTFILDEYYLGRSLRHVPGENEGIYPAWLDLLAKDFDLDSYIHNLVITGSLGTGKTMNMVVLLLYRICIATHLKNPQNFFGLRRGSRIVYNFLSVTKEAVKDTAFGEAMNFMGDSPYFVEVCGYDADSDYSGFRIPLLNHLSNGRPSNIWITAGSKGQHLIGRNVVGVGLDEGNFRLEKDPDLKAYALYDAVRTRIANRFQKISTFLPALSVIASSAADESSFTEKVVGEIDEVNRVRERENAALPPEQQAPISQIVYRHAVYRIKRHLLTGIGPGHRWFKVAYGLKNMEPFILDGLYLEDGTPVGTDTHEEPPSGAKTELVPTFYLAAYKRNCRTNLQALSGISVGGAHRLFSSMLDIEWCLEQSEREGVSNPMLPGVERIALSNEDNQHIWDSLNHRAFVTRIASRYLPIRHPERLRYGHIDLATQNLAGIGICHLVGAQLVEGLVKDGLPFSEYRLVVEYDFILTICAGQTKPISMDKIQQFFFWLRDMCGFRFGKVTADQWQCLTGDALVNSNRGLLPIRELAVGDLVATANGRAQPITRKFVYTKSPVVKITTDKGETLCGTPNHRIKAAKSTKRLCNAQFRWTRLDELKPHDWIAVADKPVPVDAPPAPLNGTTLRLSKNAHWTPPVAMTENFAEWLGLFYGDGCTNRLGMVRIAAHKKDSEDAANLMLRVFGERPRINQKRTGNGVSVYYCSRGLFRWLTRNNLAKTSAEVPESILRGNRACKAAFLRGLFSADGCINKNGEITLSSANHGLIQQVSIILKTEFGVRCASYSRQHTCFGQPAIEHILRLAGTESFQQIGFVYKSKQSVLSHFKQPGRKLGSRVQSIEHSVADVYDIQVGSDHSYFANGIVSHNSEATLQMLEAKGFEVDKLPIDRDKSVYHTWRGGFEERRIRLHRNAQMLREAEQLLEMDKKYDHPTDGSKDTTDGAAGAYFNAINSEEKNIIASHNEPAIHTNRTIQAQTATGPPVDIPLPARGYDRSKVFEA